MVLEVRCDVDIFKQSASAQYIYRDLMVLLKVFEHF